MTIKSSRYYLLNFSQNSQQYTSFRIKWMRVAAVIVVICVTLLWFETSVASRVKQIESAWLEFNVEASSAGKVLNEIINNLGYGGLIHNFKNYVLRKDPSLRSRACPGGSI